jgi:cysteine desulfurase/selenocysteine lyase
VLKWVGVDEEGNFRMDEFERAFSPRTKVVAVTHMSNVLGTIVPVKEVVRIAHAHGVPVLVDGSQGVVHLDVDVRDLDADFYAFTGHKVYGPTGIGVLYGKKALLEKMPPFMGGGEMIETVTTQNVTYNVPPHRFEAGTPAIEATIGFGAAVRWMRAVGMEAIRAHDEAMACRLIDGLRDIPGVRVLAADMPIERRIALATFVVDAPAMTQENVARALADMFGVCVSGGYHCTHVLHARAKLEGTVRASPHVFNTSADVDRLLEGVREIVG